MFLKGYYQNGYVTHDLDRAKDIVSAACGVGDYLMFDPADLEVMTPAGPRHYLARMALAWSSGIQLELIQPLNDDTRELYRDALVADTADAIPRFHHVAIRRPTRETLENDVAATGMPLLMSGQTPGFVFRYVDFRPRLGHHVEMTWATDEAWAYNQWPTDRPEI